MPDSPVNPVTDEFDKYEWRKILLSDHGPSFHVRGVLLILSEWMFGAEKVTAWPSQRKLGKACALNQSTVSRHLHEAERLGWIVICDRGYGPRGMRCYEYELSVPEVVWKESNRQQDDSMQKVAIPREDNGDVDASAHTPDAPAHEPDARLHMDDACMHEGDAYMHRNNRNNLKREASTNHKMNNLFTPAARTSVDDENRKREKLQQAMRMGLQDEESLSRATHIDQAEVRRLLLQINAACSTST